MSKFFKNNIGILIALIISVLAFCPKSVSAYWSIYSVAGFGLPGGSITGIIVGILNWLLLLFGFLGILGFVISGILYLLSAGDDDRMKRAKQAMQYSIIGIIVGLAGFIIIRTIFLILNQEFLF